MQMVGRTGMACKIHKQNVIWWAEPSRIRLPLLLLLLLLLLPVARISCLNSGRVWYETTNELPKEDAKMLEEEVEPSIRKLISMAKDMKAIVKEGEREHNDLQPVFTDMTPWVHTLTLSLITKKLKQVLEKALRTDNPKVLYVSLLTKTFAVRVFMERGESVRAIYEKHTGSHSTDGGEGEGEGEGEREEQEGGRGTGKKRRMDTHNMKQMKRRRTDTLETLELMVNRKMMEEYKVFRKIDAYLQDCNIQLSIVKYPLVIHGKKVFLQENTIVRLLPAKKI